MNRRGDNIFINKLERPECLGWIVCEKESQSIFSSLRENGKKT